MISYCAVNKIRGFLIESFNNLNSTEEINITFKSNSYEKVNKIRKIAHRIIVLPFFDWFGFFCVIKKNGKLDGYDRFISYNRFTHLDQSYYIVLENPYALVHYADRRNCHYITKKRLNKCFNDENLKGIICLSKACKDSLKNIYNVPSNVRIEQAYPIITDGEFEKKYDGDVHCLFIASEFYLKGGNEVVEAYTRLKEDGLKGITLTIITPFEKLSPKTMSDIKRLGIELKDYKLTKNEIKDEYKKTHILLNPTKMDSFSLVTLESMKYGCAYIGTDLYAIPEMVINNETGYLTSDKYSPWDQNNLFIHKKHVELRKQEKDNGVDDELALFVWDRIAYLYKNQEILKTMNIKAFKRGNDEVFSKNSCCQKWLEILNE